MSKILVIDDDKNILELVKINLEASGHEVFLVDNGIDGIALAKQEFPDLIILDLMMPFMDGFTVCTRLRQSNESRDIPILMLTALGMKEDKVKGFDLGTDDYLVKPFDIDELKVRVRALLKRTSSLPPSAAIREILTVGDMTLIPENLEVKILDKITKLTPTEFDILNALMQNYGKLLSPPTLLKEIWGYSEDDDIETVRVHIKHLRTKLDKISTGKKYIETVYGGGYRLMPEGLPTKV